MICQKCGALIFEGETIEGKKVKLELDTPTYLILEDKEGVPVVKRLPSGHPQHIHRN